MSSSPELLVKGKEDNSPDPRHFLFRNRDGQTRRERFSKVRTFHHVFSNFVEMPRKYIRCSVKDCPSMNEIGLKGITMFCFPKSRDICQKWVDFCRNPSVYTDAENGSLHSRNYVRVCAVHFSQESFCNSLQNQLNRGAIPTVTYSNEETAEAATTFPSPSNAHSSPNPSPVSLQLTPSHAFSSIPQSPFISTPSHPSRSLLPAFVSLDHSSNSNLSSPLLNPLIPIPSSPTIDKESRLSLSDLNFTRLSELTPRKLRMYSYVKAKERQLKRLQSSITKLRSMFKEPVMPQDEITQKRRKDDEFFARCQQLKKIFSDEKKANVQKTIDEFDAIGISWAAKLRKLDDVQKVLAEDLINQVLKKGFFQELTRATQISEGGIKNNIICNISSSEIFTDQRSNNNS